MAYTKTTWQDRAVQYPNRYTKYGETASEVTLVANPGTVTQAGTPLNAANLNNIEQGISERIPAGLTKRDVSEVMAFLSFIDTRQIVVTRDSIGKINKIEEKDGSTVVVTTNVNRTNGKVSSVVQIAGGKTVTYTINRTGNNITSITKGVV